jgi:hypothetical protein
MMDLLLMQRGKWVVQQHLGIQRHQEVLIGDRVDGLGVRINGRRGGGGGRPKQSCKLIVEKIQMTKKYC